MKPIPKRGYAGSFHHSDMVVSAVDYDRILHEVEGLRLLHNAANDLAGAVQLAHYKQITTAQKKAFADLNEKLSVYFQSAGRIGL